MAELLSMVSCFQLFGLVLLLFGCVCHCATMKVLAHPHLTQALLGSSGGSPSPTTGGKALAGSNKEVAGGGPPTSLIKSLLATKVNAAGSECMMPQSATVAGSSMMPAACSTTTTTTSTSTKQPPTAPQVNICHLPLTAFKHWVQAKTLRQINKLQGQKWCMWKVSCWVLVLIDKWNCHLYPSSPLHWGPGGLVLVGYVRCTVCRISS